GGHHDDQKGSERAEEVIEKGGEEEEMTSIETEPAPTTPSPLTVLILTGVINFVFGSLLAGFVTAYFAEQHSDHELQGTWMQERSKHMMSVRKEFLDEQRGTVATL